MEALSDASAALAQKLYAQGAQPGADGGGAQPGGKGGDQGPVDAEFEEVKGDDRK
jgi:molecular chaperone DnaK